MTPAGSRLNIGFLLAGAETPDFRRLTDVLYAGAIVGVVGIVLAVITLGVAAAEGADTDPAVARALTQTVAGPFLLASMGFAAMLGASDVSRPSRTGDRA